jgi:hypothetical protein
MTDGWSYTPAASRARYCMINSRVMDSPPRSANRGDFVGRTGSCNAESSPTDGSGCREVRPSGDGSSCLGAGVSADVSRSRRRVSTLAPGCEVSNNECRQTLPTALAIFTTDRPFLAILDRQKPVGRKKLPASVAAGACASRARRLIDRSFYPIQRQ